MKPCNPAVVGLYRLQDFKPKLSKRHYTDAHAKLGKTQSARADSAPFGRFNLVPEFQLSGTICSERVKFSLGPPSARADGLNRPDGWRQFTWFLLFLDPIF